MAFPGTSSSHDRAQKWLFSKQEMALAQTIKDGWPAAKELDYRQRATRCIQEMVDKLNEQMRERASKLTQLCMCSASVHMHRFYYFHSFERFPYQDVAAACLFLAGKTEESPRKLDHIVHVWWGIKFPKYRKFPQNSSVFHDSKAYIVQLENIILQTIAFDLKINLPHPIVLTLTSKNIGQVLEDHGNKKLTEVAYFFATDVLCVTNWAIRYSAGEIAVCCVDIVCKFGHHEIPKRTDGLPWYHGICTLELDKLEEMEKEFIIIYNSSKHKLALHKFALKGLPSMAAGTSGIDIKPDDSVLLPPPPVPPTIRNMGLNEYRERTKNAPPPAEKPETEKRKSFIPDMTSLPANLTLAPLNLPGMPPLAPPAQPEKSREERRDEERRREKERRKEQGKRREERPEDRERRKEEKRREEEKRKRDYGKAMGAGDNNSAQMHKKPRQEMMQHFVPATNNSHHGNNGHHKDYRFEKTIKLEPALSPPRAPPSLVGYGVPHAIAPPPPLKAPKNELEEGELE